MAQYFPSGVADDIQRAVADQRDQERRARAARRIEAARVPPELEERVVRRVRRRARLAGDAQRDPVQLRRPEIVQAPERGPVAEE